MYDQPPPSQRLFQMITGYWVSQLVGTIAELGVVDALAARPRTAAEVAKETETDAAAMSRVLRAAATVGLVRLDGDRWTTTELGDQLRAGVAGSMRDMAIAQTSTGHWAPWGRFRQAVREGKRQTPAALGCEIFEHYAKSPREGAAFSGAMNDLARLVAGEVVRLVDGKSARRVVDVGGANGTLLAAMVSAHPDVKGVLVDLPHVVDGARAALDAAGVGERCEVVGGDFFRHVPEGDLFLLKQVLHDWNDEQCTTILRNCASSLRDGGRVVIIEMVIPDDLRPSPAALMDLNMLVMLPGRERTRSEYEVLFASAGLRLERFHETHSPFQVIEAVRA